MNAGRPRLPAASAATRAGVAVVLVGALWGLYWIPLRRLDAVATAGPWATAVVLLLACLVLAPAGWRGRRRLRASSPAVLGSLALGGMSFVLYSNALLYGQVAVVILLFYLTPVWSVLISRIALRRPVLPSRWAAIACGLVGIGLVLRGDQGTLPLPQTAGDWMGLASGLLWAVAAAGMHGQLQTRAAETNFVFCTGGALVALVMAVGLAGTPPRVAAAHVPETLAWVLAIGGVWWALSMTAFVWAARVLEPARVGILLMSEVLVGTVSAALLAAEPFGPVMAAGAALVIGAGVLETLPERKAR